MFLTPIQWSNLVFITLIIPELCPKVTMSHFWFPFSNFSFSLSSVLTIFLPQYTDHVTIWTKFLLRVMFVFSLAGSGSNCVLRIHSYIFLSCLGQRSQKARLIESNTRKSTKSGNLTQGCLRVSVLYISMVFDYISQSNFGNFPWRQ